MQDDIRDRLGCVIEALSAIAVDAEIELLPAREARRLANDWRPPALPVSRAELCQLARELIDRIETNVVPLRRAG